MKKALLLLTAFLTIAHPATTQDKQPGFLHPGGLHTQADFDRVKAQLAADNQKEKEPSYHYEGSMKTRS